MLQGHTTGCVEAVIAGINAAKDDNTLDAIHALVSRLKGFSWDDKNLMASAFENKQNEFEQAEMRRRIESRRKFCAMLEAKVEDKASVAA